MSLRLSLVAGALALTALAACSPKTDAAKSKTGQGASPAVAAPPQANPKDIAFGPVGARGDFYCAGVLYQKNLASGADKDAAMDNVVIKLEAYGAAKLVAQGEVKDDEAQRLAKVQREAAAAEAAAGKSKAPVGVCNDWYMKQALACGRTLECVAQQFTGGGPLDDTPAPKPALTPDKDRPPPGVDIPKENQPKQGDL